MYLLIIYLFIIKELWICIGSLDKDEEKRYRIQGRRPTDHNTIIINMLLPDK